MEDKFDEQLKNFITDSERQEYCKYCGFGNDRPCGFVYYGGAPTEPCCAGNDPENPSILVW